MSSSASRTTSPLDYSTLPNPRHVLKVVEACNCSEDRAITLLQRLQNDVERAIRHHNILNRYLRENRPSCSRSHTPTRPFTADAPSPSNGSIADINDSSENGAPLIFIPPINEDPTRGLATGGLESRGINRKTGASRATPQALSDTTFPLGGQQVVGPGRQVVEAHPNGLGAGDGRRLSSRRTELGGGWVSEADLETKEWDFFLPRIPPPRTLNPGLDDRDNNFNIQDLVGAVRHGANLQMIRSYLERCDRYTVRRNINNDVEGFPAMFYAVESNIEPLLRLWIAHGGNPEAVHAPSNVPLLAFAIIHSENLKADTTLITATLLSLGATPNVIPPAFYTPYLRDLPENGPEDQNENDGKDDQTSRTKWCRGAARAKLARTVTLSQRYYLEKASKTKKLSQRHVQLAQRRNAEALLGIPYFLIGQTLASNLVLQRLLSHLVVPSKRPLVLVFAGPSGHGKTELARKLGHLLSLELEVVDCTIFHRESELFGPREPYVGSEKGSPLNNFLARNAGQRCIVFLDEFEKTTSNIHKTLLLPFDNGEYQDRRHRTTVDCSNTIWILATNAQDEIIQDFCAANQEVLWAEDNETEKLRLLKTLSAKIKEDFLSKFDSPITGRISAFIPFLPFSPGEQAVVVHKYLLELGTTVEGAVDLSLGPKEKLLGNVRLRIRRDASVCQVLAQSEYHSDLGARSLINAVDSIKTLLVQAYLEVNEEIKETSHKSNFFVDVNDGEIVVKMIGPKS